jgi:autotransporter passenger strand-loop-strand repeat protein
MISGGELKVASGGLADPAFIASGGNETVIAGGIGAQTFGGTRDVFGFASGAVAFTGSQSTETGSQAIDSGGTASSPTIESGGLVLASSGGIASNMRINSGDFESGGGNWTSRQADQEE